MSQDDDAPPACGSEPPLFRDLQADDDLELMEMESFCVNCEENGMTRMLLTKIPFFREVIIMSFRCEHCGYSNNDIKPGSMVQDQGVRISVQIRNAEDLSRQVVKSDSATLKIPELDLEVPPSTQKGILTTVEGVMERVIEGLKQDQTCRRISHENLAIQIDDFILKLKHLIDLEETFTVIVDDPAGNSFIENLSAPQKDEHMEITHYDRTQQDIELLGLYKDESSVLVDGNGDTATPDPEEIPFVDEVLTFPSNCSECGSPCVTNMKQTDIPHFKQIILMATICDHCGCRTNEVKSGAGIEELGKRYIVHITDPSDMNRDVLKSETCALSIPEIAFEMQPGTLGGKFTTLEGLISSMAKQLGVNSFMFGDSATDSKSKKLKDIVNILNRVAEGKMMDIHIVLDDPAGNSYLQNVYAPDPDPEMKVEKYERTPEQNDDLGLTGMVTENYETD